MTVERDEILLRKKARRRLIGAVLLTLIAVLSLPLVLEDPSRPLGDAPNIVIPEIAGQQPPRAAKVPDSLPDENVGEEALPVEGGNAQTTDAVPAAASPAAPRAEPSRAEQGGRAEAAKLEAKPDPAAKPAPAYVLQLGVFKERANADAVASKASDLGLQPVVAQAGEGAWRVGLGPFQDKAKALAVRDKVRQAGLDVTIKKP
jgi:DedD protein